MEEDETSKSLGSLRNSRPHITLRIPSSPPGSTTSRPHMYTGPLTPTAINISDGGFNFMYPGKAGQFVSNKFISFRDFTLKSAKSGLSVGEKVSLWIYSKVWALSRKWFTHFFLCAIVVGYSLLGGFLFMEIEGGAQQESYDDIVALRKNLVLHIKNLYEEAQPLQVGTEGDLLWQGRSTRAIMEYEFKLFEHFKQDSNILAKGDKPAWDFWHSVFFCGTIFTTIGYGHIAPVTNSGRALTIAYSIIGIPLFLILLADFGKLFTRSMKFLWAFVRRLYYTGHCRKVRRTGPVQDMMKGMQMVVDTIRRPSMFPQEGMNKNFEAGGDAGTPGDPPSTPALSTFAIDDEFNLPISVAITILLIYIFMGATVFWYWEEDWSFFEAFYFVFISMSTIGFGDLVPKNQMYMMASIVYLAFGLALTSMCINVVQEKLSDSFRKASAKIGATIGLHVSEDDGTISPVSPTHVEIAEVHRPSPALSTKKVP